MFMSVRLEIGRMVVLFYFFFFGFVSKVCVKVSCSRLRFFFSLLPPLQIKEIKEVIELPIKHPELFESLGIAQPKGVLLFGPPGTGKTLLARAVAHHTDCTFIRVSGSELVQKYIGEGSRMVRELFVMAREHAPSIIFMDEIDSIGSARAESGSGNGDSEVQRTMLELLNQLDGFEATNKIKVANLLSS